MARKLNFNYFQVSSRLRSKSRVDFSREPTDTGTTQNELKKVGTMLEYQGRQLNSLRDSVKKVYEKTKNIMETLTDLDLMSKGKKRAKSEGKKYFETKICKKLARKRQDSKVIFPNFLRPS